MNKIINSASRLSSKYEKELYVHNTLINKISYVSNSAYNQTSYSAIVNNQTVCAGYAKAFQYIMNQLGITTYYVTGTSEGENHAWNIIKLDDGYYNIDLTWDDAAYNHYKYFNINDFEFSKTHSRGYLSKQLPPCYATTYTYKKKENKEPKTTEQEIKDTKKDDEKVDDKPIDDIKEPEEIEEESVEENKEEEEENETINDKDNVIKASEEIAKAN